MKTRIGLMFTALLATVSLLIAQPVSNAPAPPPAAVPIPNAKPEEVSLEQLRALATVIRQQRDALSQQLLDAQTQIQILAQDNERLKKENAELTAKAPAPEPKK